MTPSDENNNILIKDEEKLFYSETPEFSVDAQDPGEVKSGKWPKIRTGMLFVMVTGLSLLFILWLFEDVSYFFCSKNPTDLGLADDLGMMSLKPNEFVKIQGVARDMCIRAELLIGRVRFFYFLGSEMGSRILVEDEAQDNEKCIGAIEGSFIGRVLDFSSNKKYVNVLNYYRTHFAAAPQSGPMYLIQNGKIPWSEWWYPVAFSAVVLLWLWNIRILYRRYRR